MASTNALFLKILSAALRGRKFQPDDDVTPEQWQKLLRTAAVHNVLPLIFESVHPLLPVPMAAGVRRQVREQVILQTLRTGEFLELNRHLREAGVTPLVVKGIVCRELYPQPDHRPSSDEDILIPPEQLDLCRRLLEDFGMSTTEESPDQVHEIPYRKEGSPLYIELHKHLFPPQSQAYGDLNGYFPDVFRSAAEIGVQGQKILTMHPTDHMTYLIFHAFKHFLHSGFGIRQVCDILLFAKEYDDSIDWDWVRLSCRSIRAEKFAAAVFRIGSEYLDFAPAQAWASVPAAPGPLLADILEAGVYGSADLSRQHSSSITLEAAAASKQDRQAPSGLLVSVFPPARKLEHRYPWLKQHPYLLPAAWTSRLWTYLHETRRSAGNSAADALKTGTERVELLRQYGIIQ